MLKPTHTPTRELVNLDGVWRFGIDTRLAEQPWLAPLDTPLEAAVPGQLQRPVHRPGDPRSRRLGLLPARGARASRVGRGADPAALRRGDPRRPRLRRRPAGRRARRRVHPVRRRPHRRRGGREDASGSRSPSAATSRTRPCRPARSRSAWTAVAGRPTSTTSTTTPASPGRSGCTARHATTSPTSPWSRASTGHRAGGLPGGDVGSPPM